MDAAFSTEQDEIRRTLRGLITKRCGPDAVKAAVRTPSGHDSALWAALAGQLGLPGLALPEAYGGAGCTAAELALGCEELGRALVPSPLLATAVLAAPLILALGTEEQRAAHLPRIAAGGLGAAPPLPPAPLSPALGSAAATPGDWARGGPGGGGGGQHTGGGRDWRGMPRSDLGAHGTPAEMRGRARYSRPGTRPYRPATAAMA
ncbi:acyl-CoA dehydrogenase family protein, partial [Streptomyces sp. G44]|uniref:acyl-CoA dehydrogenase family protein n=1 Tax=Streptomyces sp. G44 TaxID=2807632 RepID=UPI00195FE3C7